MRALRSFTVRPRLPESLAALNTLAMNLRWTWDDRTRQLFHWADPDAWDAVRHDPVRLLGALSRDRIKELDDDPSFRHELDGVVGDFERYLGDPRWFQRRMPSPLRLVGYFSPEFGLSETIPQYSGGLGVLAGDHLKAASDLGVPIVGVGLFYRHGYFRQSLGFDGWQQERFAPLDPHGMAMTLCEGVRIEVALGRDILHAQVWRVDVGRTPLYLLDADVEENANELRAVTDRLYGGDVEHRLRQEILLGMGGVRALEQLGRDVQVFHTNEGHAGFLGLERIRRAITHDRLSFAEALEAVRAGNIFTTHTPVPAGIDRFPRELMTKYFSGWCDDTGVSLDDLMKLGHRPQEDAGEPFNMAVMGLHLAGRSNAVAALHGEVSRAMFTDLWPDVPAPEIPIESITNGVHGRTWVSSEVDDLLGRRVSPAWEDGGTIEWGRVEAAPDDEIWRVREHGRARLVSFVRESLARAGASRGASPSDLAWCADALDPHVLTIGFARRFATYKRANLLLREPERLRSLLLDPERPVQFVFAGKAHPADDLGKGMIRDVVHFASDPAVRHRFVFVDDYDMAIARHLYQGCDVWLNTPRRPQEACGTSGMKAALNGSLNCSILDGWWDECFDGDNGWAVTSAPAEADLARRDEIEADSLFEILERQVVPLFYRRHGSHGVPHDWIRKMKHSWTTLGPRVTASRMVRDYTTDLYEPTGGRADALASDNWSHARALAAWKSRVLGAWGGVKILSVDADTTVADLGAERRVDAVVSLGGLTAADVEVQLVHGRVGRGDTLDTAHTVAMTRAGDAGAEERFTGSFTCEAVGHYGFTVRIVPAHPDLASAVELGRIIWA